MVKILSYLTKDDILEFTEPDINKVNDSLIKHCLRDYDEDVQEKALKLLAKQKNGKSLNLTRGFALSHIRMDEVRDIRMAVGLLEKRVKFGKGLPVQAVFCLIIPKNKSQAYLSLMAHLNRLLSEKDAGKVFLPGNKKGIIEFIREFEDI